MTPWQPCTLIGSTRSIVPYSAVSVMTMAIASRCASDPEQQNRRRLLVLPFEYSTCLQSSPTGSSTTTQRKISVPRSRTMTRRARAERLEEKRVRLDMHNNRLSACPQSKNSKMFLPDVGDALGKPIWTVHLELPFSWAVHHRTPVAPIRVCTRSQRGGPAHTDPHRRKMMDLRRCVYTPTRWIILSLIFHTWIVNASPPLVASPASQSTIGAHHCLA